MNLAFSASTRMAFQDSLERDYEVDVASLFRDESDGFGKTNMTNATVGYQFSKLQIQANESRKFNQHKKETNPSRIFILNTRDINLIYFN